MVISLEAGEDFTYEPKEGAWAEVRFASFSAREDRARLVVEFNGRLVDTVTTPVPHSWWPPTSQTFCPELHPGDTLRVSCEVGPLDLRLDLVEHESAPES